MSSGAPAGHSPQVTASFRARVTARPRAAAHTTCPKGHNRDPVASAGQFPKTAAVCEGGPKFSGSSRRAGISPYRGQHSGYRCSGALGQRSRDLGRPAAPT